MLSLEIKCCTKASFFLFPHYFLKDKVNKELLKYWNKISQY